MAGDDESFMAFSGTVLVGEAIGQHHFLEGEGERWCRRLSSLGSRGAAAGVACSRLVAVAPLALVPIRNRKKG
jgi:hypothetical protein